ncbi:MAG TPA: metal-sulfur cluster assembly factor [Chloroflexota bacterium]
MTLPVLTTEDAVREALREVIDPELGENLVDLGLVYGVRVQDARVEVDLTLTTPGCPLHASLHAAAERAIRLMVPGVRDVVVDIVFEPRWTPERVSPAARQRLGFA